MPPFAESKLDRRIAQLGGKMSTRVLVCCGDAIRKKAGEPESARTEDTERALSALSVADAAAAVREVDVSAVASSLARASADAFEAAFAESDEERELFLASAVEGLAARDRVASIAVAARARAAMAAQSGDAATSLESACADLDQRLQQAELPRVAWSRSLSGANAARRALLATLTEEAAAGAWWYAARSEDDDLLGALAGEIALEGARLSEAGRADVARSALANGEALDSAALLGHALGRIDPAAEARAVARASKDASMREAIALAADRAIEADADRGS
ncbi:MAG TPA: hypothetical protein VL400_20265 [Polyangiaceae bacterium]|nr:hypothetical protein [Polyangiaceae bacterium]